MDPKDRAEIYRQNARKSTGPRTEAGKDISRYNALKHGLNSRRLVNPETNEDKQAFDAFEASYENEYQPQNLAEIQTVKSLVEMRWQLMRAARLLELTYVRGGDLLATARMLDAFSRHECRLQKTHDGLFEKLQAMQAARQANQEAEAQAESDAEAEAQTKAEPTATNQPANPVPIQHKPIHLDAIGFVPLELADPKIPSPEDPQNNQPILQIRGTLKPAA